MDVKVQLLMVEGYIEMSINFAKTGNKWSVYLGKNPTKIPIFTRLFRWILIAKTF